MVSWILLRRRLIIWFPARRLCGFSNCGESRAIQKLTVVSRRFYSLTVWKGAGAQSPECFESSVFLAVDIEQLVYPGHLKQGLHLRVDMDKFHVAACLPDAAKAPGQFAQAIAVNVIHALEINQELLVAAAGKDMNKVAQLRAAVRQREPSYHIDHNDAIALSRCDLKTHICLRGWLFLPESYAWLSPPSRLAVHIPSSPALIDPNCYDIGDDTDGGPTL